MKIRLTRKEKVDIITLIVSMGNPIDIPPAYGEPLTKDEQKLYDDYERFIARVEKWSCQ